MFGDPPVAPRAVMRVQVSSGQGLEAGRDEADRFVDAGAELVVLDSDGASTRRAGGGCRAARPRAGRRAASHVG